MNISILNGTCSDLKHVMLDDKDQFMIAFCLSSDKAGESEGALQTYVTVVQIRDYDLETPVIRYFT